jgi:hypothetical protein
LNNVKLTKIVWDTVPPCPSCPICLGTGVLKPSPRGVFEPDRVECSCTMSNVRVVEIDCDEYAEAIRNFAQTK